MVTQLNPSDFQAWRDNAEAMPETALPVVLDVREPWELQTASVRPHGFELVHIPMREVPARVAELQDKYGSDFPIACLCHHGMRSLQVANYLTQSGFTEVVNLQGGIDAWAKQVDTSIPLY
jgi:rhodanese-related sulfurtransferase